MGMTFAIVDLSWIGIKYHSYSSKWECKYSALRSSALNTILILPSGNVSTSRYVVVLL